MKEIPVLFSGSMPSAIIAGWKTNTRRIITPAPLPESYMIEAVPPGTMKFHHRNGNDGWRPSEEWQFKESYTQVPLSTYRDCPYGKPGDLLYVRESYYQYGKWKYADKLTKGGKVKSEFVPMEEEIVFEPTVQVRGVTFQLELEKNTYRLPAWYKRLGRFMPKKYSRIWLRVTSVRAERLQDITAEDAIAEGIEKTGDVYRDYSIKEEDNEGYNYFRNPVDSFKSLWVSINGQESWDANPWVWAVSFEVLSTTGKPSL